MTLVGGGSHLARPGAISLAHRGVLFLDEAPEFPVRVLDALRPQPKTFGVSFFLRNERTLDLLLLDARDPGAALLSLRRAPAVCIVAPPRGELLGIGTRGRTSLDAYLRQVAPPGQRGGGPTMPPSTTVMPRSLSNAAMYCVRSGLIAFAST